MCEAYRSSIAVVKEKVEKFNQTFDVAALLNGARTGSDSSAAGSTSATTPARVLCRPVFDSAEAPPNLGRVFNPPEVMTSADLAAKKECLCRENILCFYTIDEQMIHATYDTDIDTVILVCIILTSIHHIFDGNLEGQPDD